MESALLRWRTLNCFAKSRLGSLCDAAEIAIFTQAYHPGSTFRTWQRRQLMAKETTRQTNTMHTIKRESRTVAAKLQRYKNQHMRFGASCNLANCDSDVRSVRGPENLALRTTALPFSFKHQSGSGNSSSGLPVLL